MTHVSIHITTPTRKQLESTLRRVFKAEDPRQARGRLVQNAF